MPIYEYVCDDCGERYEMLVMNQRQAVTCPKCTSSKHTLQLSVFAAPSNGKSSAGSSAAASSGGACGCTPRSCGCH